MQGSSQIHLGLSIVVGGKSALVEVMDRCHEVPCHFLTNVDTALRCHMASQVVTSLY